MIVLRLYDESGYVVPHCRLCMEEVRLGDQVIVQGPYGMYSIIHAICEHLNKSGEYDRGEFSDPSNLQFCYLLRETRKPASCFFGVSRQRVLYCV